MAFDFVDPAASNRCFARRERSEGPGVISFQCCQFRLHGSLPLGNGSSFGVRTGLNVLANGGSIGAKLW